MSDLWKLSASEVAALVVHRKVSAGEVARSALARLNDVNPRLNAVVDHRPEDAIEQARLIDASLARGESVGPLAGVPVTIKVNADQAGYATTNGLKLQKDLIATTTNPAVENLRKAGAVIIGRTNTPAFSCRWFTNNQLHGRTLNPRNASLTPGGSSGGAASAVAAGIGHIALGTDIAGSIRYPAYACGVHGIRPSHGRVAAYNATDIERKIGQQLMSVTGPLARTIGDVRLGLAAMSVGDPKDIWWVPAPLVGHEVPRIAAMCLRPDGMNTQPDIVDALQDAAQKLRDAGWRVDEIESLPPIRELCEIQIALWIGESGKGTLEAAEREGDQGAIIAFKRMADLVAPVTAEKLAATFIRRASYKREWLLFLQRYPVVLLPVSAELPFPDDLDLQGPAAVDRVWEAQMTMIGLAVLGIPALAVATAMRGGNPVGVQILSGPYREDLCLAAGEAIEARSAPMSIAGDGNEKQASVA